MLNDGSEIIVTRNDDPADGDTGPDPLLRSLKIMSPAPCFWGVVPSALFQHYVPQCLFFLVTSPIGGASG